MEGIYRILCLGDSMLFGCGVMQDETLPAHLEIILNEAHTANHVEVINGAVAGFSIYDEWNRFVLKGHRYNPDLLIIVLDDNDAELISYPTLRNHGGKITYKEHVENCWRDGSPHLPHFIAEMENINRQSLKLSIPIILAFYRISTSPAKRRSVSIIEELCSRYNMGFVDLSTEYWDSIREKKNSKYWVSEADGHPSSLAHRIAAEKLSHYITKINLISDKSEIKGNGTPLHNFLLNHSLEMHKKGYSEEYLYYHLHHILNMKCVSGFKFEEEVTSSHQENHLRKSLTYLSELSQFNYHLLFWEAYGRVLSNNRDDFFDPFQYIDVNIANIAKALFIFSNVLLDRSLAWVNYYPETKPSEFDITESIKTVNFLANFSRQLSDAGNILSSFSESPLIVDSDHPLGHFSHLMQIRRINITKSIFSYWKELDNFLTSLIVLFEEFISLFKEYYHGDSIDLEKDSLWRSFLGIGKALNDLAVFVINKMQPFMNFPRLPPSCSNGIKKPVTCLKITLAAEAEEPFVVWVQTSSAVPERRPLSDLKYLICDGKMHDYYFEFPLFFLGKLSILFETKTDVFVEELLLYNNPDEVTAVSFPHKITPESNQFEASEILLRP